MNDLAALLGGGGGAAPAAPLPSGPDPSLQGGGDLAAMLGASGAGADPDDPMGGAVAPQFPSTDPQAVNSILEQLLMMQQQDQSTLHQEQMQTLAADPLLQSLLGGAPMMPGAGQDAQAIGAMGDIAPDPNLPA